MEINELKTVLEQLKVEYTATYNTVTIQEISNKKLSKIRSYMSDFDNVVCHYGIDCITIIIEQ